MSTRLTTAREHVIRDGQGGIEALTDVLAELDAVRAERDEFKKWADNRHEAAVLADENYQRYDIERERAERAEATLAAIRASVLRPLMTSEAKRLRADIDALLDEAPKETL